jgi:microcystin-dependent protein
MTKIDLAYDLVNYTPATATPVEANFDRVEQHINQEIVERDGTVAMRAQLKLVGDPVAALDAAPKQYVDQVLPIGIIMMHGGTSAPPGGRWAICNGAEIQTANNPELYNIIGHNFSPAGTPSSRFHLPNLRDRMPMGIGTSTTVGETGGYRSATLVQHDHTLSSHVHGIGHNHGEVTSSSVGDHNHNIGGGTQLIRAGGSGMGATGSVAFGPVVHNFDGGHSHTVNLPSFSGNSAGPSNNSTSEAGSTATDKNLPPFLGVQYIIRVK